MRILLDENMDRKLRDAFKAEHDVTTVRDQGWSGKKNGDLLRAAEAEFDVLVTLDKNRQHPYAYFLSPFIRVTFYVLVARRVSDPYPRNLIHARCVQRLNTCVSIQKGKHHDHYDTRYSDSEGRPYRSQH